MDDGTGTGAAAPGPAAIDAAARTLFIRHQTMREDSSMEWTVRYWDRCAHREHLGDCPVAVHKGPVTCDRCVCDEWRADAEAALLAAASVEKR